MIRSASVASSTRPLVAVGVPTFNRPDGLLQTVRSIQAQTFSNLEILISDNASNDRRVGQMCTALAAEDSRIRFHRHERNTGATANMLFCLAETSAPYFMWASDDDLWEPQFVERGVSSLHRIGSNYSAWFCTIDNINSDGQTCRRYPGFSRFNSTPARALDLMRYLLEPEILGKANLIYALFKRAALQEATSVVALTDPRWGVDMCLVYAFLTRFRIAVSDEVLMHKRVPTSERDITPSDPGAHVFPPSCADEYLNGLLMAAQGTRYRWMTEQVTRYRRKIAARYNRSAVPAKKAWATLFRSAVGWGGAK